MLSSRDRRVAFAVGLLGLSVGLLGFWVTAAEADWFLDRPFTYSGPGFVTGNFVKAGIRGLARSEGVLAATTFVFLLPAILVACRSLARATDDGYFSRIQDALAKRAGLVVWIAAATAAAGAAFVAFAIVRGAHMQDDERAYEFQAKLFSRGLASLPSPPAALRNQTFLTTPVWASKYPPGNSLVMAIGARLGDVRFVRPVLAAALVYFVFVFVRSAWGERQAIAAAALTALSPFVWAQYGVLLASGTTACACAAFLAGLARSAETGKVRFALFAGLAIGSITITRPYEGVALGAPVATMLVVQAIRKHPNARARMGGVLLGFASVVWILLLHNKSLTGSPFRLPWQATTPFNLGFTRVFTSIPYNHSLGAAVANLVTVGVRWDLWMLGFPGSMLLVLTGLLRGEQSPFDALLATLLGSFVLFMSLVYGSGPWDTGPYYYFVCFPILIALAVRGWHWCLVCAARAGDAVLRRALAWIPVVGAAVCWLAIAPIHFVSIAALCDEVRAPWELIGRAPYGDFLVALGTGLDRRSPGWAQGYPYTIATGRGTTARLFHAHTDAEEKEAIDALGPGLPVYRLEVDKELFDREGKRVYALVPEKRE